MPPKFLARRAAVTAALCLFGYPSLLLFAAGPSTGAEQTHKGYYRDPAVHGDTIVFTSEGDLWTVSVHGGVAQRLTTAPGTESMAAISPDGKTVAFLADYEGPEEVYTMPIGGGLPERRTWEGNARPAGWAPDGRLMIATSRYSTLPGDKLVLVDAQGKREICSSSRGGGGHFWIRREDALLYPMGQTVEFNQALQGRLVRKPVALRWPGRGRAADSRLRRHFGAPHVLEWPRLLSFGSRRGNECLLYR
jgi:dipeptidyl aminopeptidase/acylaminoacyl peptidase